MQKYLRMVLDAKLDFKIHLQNVFNKVNEAIGLIRKLHNTLLRAPLITFHKSFIRPHLDYEGVIYDEAYNNCFHQKIELVEYNASSTIPGAIRGTARG